ncbi:MAG: ComEC/Rec2 family competence protein [Actinobacteria bacterium]|nr:ComEC/Rec2 family competence protein [Actinomycetota bacterium]
MTRPNDLAGLLVRHPRHTIAASIVFGLVLCRFPEQAFLCLAVSFALLLAACGARAHIAIGACAAIVLAGAIGQARLGAIDADPLAIVPSNAKVTLRGYLLQHPKVGDHGTTMRVSVFAAGDKRQPIEVRTYARHPADVAIGDEVIVRGRLSEVALTARTPAARSYARFLLRNGVRRRLRAEQIGATGARRTGVAGAVDAIRRRSERTLATGLGPETGALLRGMVLGGDNGIPEQTTDAFRVAGLTHILAVSGQNVLLLIILVQAIATATGIGRTTRLLVPVCLICVYVPLCGAQASVVRAGVMGLVGLAAIIASRPTSRAYALLLGAIGVLAYNPRATADVGAQLSFAAVLGIIAFTRPLASRLGRWPRWAAEAFAATAGATIATAPLMAYHFGTFSVISLAANVVGEPLIGPIVWLGSLAAAIGQFWPSAGALLNAPNEFLLGSLVTIAHSAAAVPGAQVAIPRFGGVTLALLSLPVMAAGCLANGFGSAILASGRSRLGLASGVETLRARRRSRLRDGRHIGHGTLRSARRRARPRAVTLVAPPLLAVVLAVLLLKHHNTSSPLPRPSIVFLDVGQGDATLLLGSDQCEVLIDGGPPGRGIVERLERLGVKRLDLVVATHPQLDHDGGLGEIARAGRPAVSAMLDGGGSAADERIFAMRRRLTTPNAASNARPNAASNIHPNAASDIDPSAASDARPNEPFDATSIATPRPARIEPAEAGRSWHCGDLAIEVIGPAPMPPDAPPPADPNTRAAVTIADVGGLRLLASGDAESPQLLPLPLPAVDVLKVPHHGSADDGLAAVLARIRPSVAVVEVGRENRYGHPVPQTLVSLSDAGAKVFRTDRDGTVVISPSPTGAVVRRHAEGG